MITPLRVAAVFLLVPLAAAGCRTKIECYGSPCQSTIEVTVSEGTSGTTVHGHTLTLTAVDGDRATINVDGTGRTLRNGDSIALSGDSIPLRLVSTDSSHHRVTVSYQP